MADTASEKWALLIAVDRYSDEVNDKRNLLGAVRDVEHTATFLRTGLGIPSDHITLLKATNDPTRHCEHLAALPTRVAVVAALRDLAMRSKPGDFAYIHYSGHGDRVPTKYPDLKGGCPYDEILCTLEEDIRDVEFGHLLDELADKGLVLCVVLDCCYAGGTMRLDHQAKIRCRSIASGSASMPRDNHQCPPERHPRNATPPDTWFYRQRAYNIFAACQPHEAAQEWTADDGQVYGAMTYHLLQSLKSLQHATEPVTYRLVQEVLEAKCKSKFKQQPMHLGDGSRVLFGSMRASAFGLANLVASVVETQGESVTLNKGLASMILPGDRFRIYDPAQMSMGFLRVDAQAAAEAVTTAVTELRCRAALVNENTGTLQRVEIGWFAQLSSRVKAATVNFILPESKQKWAHYSALRHLQQDCHLFAVSPIRLTVQINASDRGANLTAELDETGAFRFRDWQGHPMAHVPALRTMSSSFNTEWAIFLLQHLCVYQLVASVKCQTSSYTVRYEMEVLEDVVDESDTESLAAWRIRFKNMDSRVLYVTMLNLGPAYGVHQIFPDDGASSMAVEPGEEIPPFIIDMKVPPLLRTASSDPDFTMRDVIKVFVTTEQANFSHYRMPDLRGLDEVDECATVLRSVTRNGRLLLSPPVRTCKIEEREIITTGKHG
ncbi:hypothetical protein MFIFM68171_07355 [Madurella fahalii]|uniref:Peptidase C14 caspase domain-containing protein n=1 Tax=Madurella fahalii TaxID=1157608 RepID=A0ABQ0GHW5_9PEZI